MGGLTLTASSLPSFSVRRCACAFRCWCRCRSGCRCRRWCRGSSARWRSCRRWPHWPRCECACRCRRHRHRRVRCCRHRRRHRGRCCRPSRSRPGGRRSARRRWPRKSNGAAPRTRSASRSAPDRRKADACPGRRASSASKLVKTRAAGGTSRRLSPNRIMALPPRSCVSFTRCYGDNTGEGSRSRLAWARSQIRLRSRRVASA
jgi:hypothetical protein